MLSESTSPKQNPYLEKATELLEEATKLHVDKKHWEYVLEKENCTLHRRPRDGSTVPCFLVETSFKKPKQDVLKNIWGDSFKEEDAKKNDPKLIDWRVVEKEDNKTGEASCEASCEASWKVISQHNKMGFPIWPRQITFAQTRIDQDNKTYLVAYSVNHPSAKVDTSKYVESIICISVYCFTDNGDKTTSVWRITQADPCGNVPVWLINLYAGNLVDMFNKWKQ
jgi:hypothetical protein